MKLQIVLHQEEEHSPYWTAELVGFHIKETALHKSWASKELAYKIAELAFVYGKEWDKKILPQDLAYTKKLLSKAKPVPSRDGSFVAKWSYNVFEDVAEGKPRKATIVFTDPLEIVEE